MAKTIGTVTDFSGGLSDSPKSGVKNSFAGGRGIDFRSNPNQITALPKAIKHSGSIIENLVLWGERTCSSVWFYDLIGNIYKLSGGTYTKVHTAAESQGNGLAYYPEDDNLYYAQNTTLGRYTQACAETGTFVDDFLGSVGGEPTNTNSIDFEASSSQSATRADTASLSLTGDFTLEAYIKPESLPTGSDQMTIMSKWEEDGTTLSYKLGIIAVSNFFGDGSDGALTISSNTTEAPIDANCTGTSGTNTLTVSNVTGTFVAGQKIMIHQSRGTNYGAKQLNEITGVSGSTLTLKDNLTFSPAHSATTTVANKAQVRVMKQYSAVTINSGVTYAAKAWDGLKGGIIGWYCSGTSTITGSVSATNAGFKGGSDSVSSSAEEGGQGEGVLGIGSRSVYANGSGGAGGYGRDQSQGGNAGSGGSHASAGGAGTAGIQTTLITGSSDLSTMVFGGGGGGAGTRGTSSYNAGLGGANGGGAVIIAAATITVSGGIHANGSDCTDAGAEYIGGAGAGGSVLLYTQTGTLGSGLVTANGGASESRDAGASTGGAGGDGRVAVYYSGSISGSTSPTQSSNVDSSLASSDGHALRLYISSTGSNSETYTQEISNPQDTWARFSVSFDASESEANFYRNGVLLGTKTGTFTSVHDNASEFALGAYTNSGGSRTGFFDGLMDDVRVWNAVRTESQILQFNNRVLAGTESFLVAYYEFSSDVTDSQTSGNNDLTANNTPTYSTDVPFSGVTTRSDQDQIADTSGQTYTLATTISEGATHRQTFVPAKDPQKSITVNIAAVGTGDWTMTVHDALNREVASKTVANASLNTGLFEFVFTSWRPVLGQSYHLHITSTVADGTVVTGTTNDLETAYFTSHYQFLVSDEFHPMLQILQVMAIGNERYLATLEGGDIYNPHRLTLPSGYRIRCLAYWREYLAIGCVVGDEIGDTDVGKIFFWDGTAGTYNHFIDVPEGSINTMKGSKGLLYFLAGYSGDLMAYGGGYEAVKLKRLPQFQRDQSITFYPGALNMWKSLLHIGTGESDSDTIERGVYTWGSLNENYADSLGMDYPLSLGVQTSSNVEVGMIYPEGKDLYVSWKNINSYGVDKVSESNSPLMTAEWESLRADFQGLARPKEPLVLRADFEPLRDGESVQLKYRTDRGSWVYSDTVDTENFTEARVNINQIVKEIDVGVILTSDTTSPVVTAITLETELNEEHRGA